jgi:DMSO/TMAO reductase YedYZ molybdopterin-dependent catalytic subunit
MPEQDRRSFLKLAAASAAGLLAAGCGWDGGRFGSVLRAWEEPNAALQRLLVSDRASREFPEGRESGRMPQYFISPRVPTVDVAAWRLAVGGSVANPVRLSLHDLMRLPRRTMRVRHYCVEGWTAVAEWTGVPLAEIAALVRPAPGARFVEFRSFDSGYWSSWDLESALHPQTLVAYGMNGRALPPGHGAPARLYSNRKYGYKSVKYLTDVNFLPVNTGGYYERMGYEWYAAL